MFESVSRDSTLARQARALFRKTLPVSLVAHVAAVVGITAPSIWAVRFPSQAPAVMTAYSLIEPPALPPPPPPPPAPAKAQTLVEPVKKEVTYQLLAPTVIPDAIPVVAPEPYVEAPVEGAQENGVEGGIAGGVAGGEIGGNDDGFLGGQVGGTVGSVPPPPPVDDGRVIVPRDATLRMHALSKTFPMYPENARIRGWEDDVIVRYVIGTNGKVKSVEVLEGSDHKDFDEATVNAIRFWRFRPMIKDGKPVEVVHELTIKYRLNV